MFWGPKGLGSRLQGLEGLSNDLNPESVERERERDRERERERERASSTQKGGLGGKGGKGASGCGLA